MSVSHKKSWLQCKGYPKRCNNKSARETNVETAFKTASQQGWTKKVVSEKCTEYFCAKCSHKIKMAVSEAKTA